MRDLFLWITTYAVNSLWQVPLVVLMAAFISRVFMRKEWELQHRLWVGCLFLCVLTPSLKISLPRQLSCVQKDAENRLAALFPAATPSNETQQLVKASPVQGNVPWSPRRYADWIGLLYGFALCIGAARFLRAVFNAGALLRTAQEARLSPDLKNNWEWCCQQFSLPSVRLLCSDELISPSTLCWPFPVLVLPSHFVEEAKEDLKVVFCHELAHIRRQDFYKNLALEALSLPIHFHPALWWLKKQIARTRELLCDEIAAEAIDGRALYARALLRLAKTSCTATVDPMTTHALGIFDGNILEERVMNLAHAKAALSTRRKAIAVASSLTAMILLSTAFSLLSAPPVGAQSTAGSLESYIGLWALNLNDKQVGTLQLITYKGKLIGSITEGHAKAEDGKVVAIEPKPGSLPIVEGTIVDGALHIIVAELHDASAGFRMTLDGENHGKLLFDNRGPHGEVIEFVITKIPRND
jgi:beta-lactamase regulating signal transducer with metallopeptidase domain